MDKSAFTKEMFEKALNKACIDAADSCCPHEIYDYECDKCDKCPHQGELHEDTERDIACWENYYLQEAYKEAIANR